MDTSARTFVVRVYPEGSSTVQDVRSGRRIAAATIDQIGAQITELLVASNDPRPHADLSSPTPQPTQPSTSD